MYSTKSVRRRRAHAGSKGLLCHRSGFRASSSPDRFPLPTRSITINQTRITDLILSGGQYYGYGYGGSAGTGVGSLTTTPSDPSIDYLPIGNPDAGPDAGETAGQVRADDITTLFVGLSGPNVRVTRIRSDIAHSAMTKDFVLQASSDQSELSNVRDVTQSINENCPPQPTCGGTS
jgi:hypothetical protein